MARKLISPSRTTVRYLLPSPKNGGRSIECESTLEHDFALLTEFSRRVAVLNFQIEKQITEGSLSFTTHIDFEVILDTGELEYHEVKYLDKSQQPDVAERLAATKKQLSREGYSFFVDTELTVRKHPHLINNLTVLRRFKTGNHAYAESLRERVPSTLTTVEQLVRDVGDNNTAIAMIAWQWIYCDYTSPLNNHTPIRPMEDDDHALLYH